MRFADLRRFALSLPGVTEQPHHELGSFRVMGRIFVTVPPDREYIHVFISGQDREQALAVHPGFTEKLLWGGKVVGLRVHLANGDASPIRQLVRQAWGFKAPRGLRGSLADP
jgi:hypothetical protein